LFYFTQKLGDIFTINLVIGMSKNNSNHKTKCYIHFQSYKEFVVYNFYFYALS